MSLQPSTPQFNPELTTAPEIMEPPIPWFKKRKARIILFIIIVGLAGSFVCHLLLKKMYYIADKRNHQTVIQTNCKDDSDCVMPKYYPATCCDCMCGCEFAISQSEDKRQEQWRAENCRQEDYASCPLPRCKVKSYEISPVCQDGNCEVKKTDVINNDEKKCQQDSDCVLADYYSESCCPTTSCCSLECDNIFAINQEEDQRRQAWRNNNCSQETCPNVAMCVSAEGKFPYDFSRQALCENGICIVHSEEKK